MARVTRGAGVPLGCGIRMLGSEAIVDQDDLGPGAPRDVARQRRRSAWRSHRVPAAMETTATRGSERVSAVSDVLRLPAPPWWRGAGISVDFPRGWLAGLRSSSLTHGRRRFVRGLFPDCTSEGESAEDGLDERGDLAVERYIIAKGRAFVSTEAVPRVFAVVASLHPPRFAAHIPTREELWPQEL
jgi:hypothetical protein